MNRFRNFNALMLCACALGFPPAIERLYGQAATASMSGSVTDASGAAIPVASVVVKNTGTAAIQTLATDSQGRYTVPDLAIGTYDVQATKPGFQTAARTGITLAVGSAPVVDFQLAVGRSEQTVSVSGQLSEVETNTAAVSSLVDQQQMRELPLNGRNFEQLILLAPGVNTYPAGGESALTSRAPAYSIGGARPEGYANLLDGQDTLNWWQRGSGASVTGNSLGIESIAEFQTITNSYSAEFGGNGAVINSVTKSGTNSFHGSAYDFLRNSDLDARGFFDLKAPPPFRKNQFGGSLGGPVKKDKIFFFVNYEGIRQLLGQATPVFTPDANARLGIVGNTTVTVNPVIQQILKLYPLPSAETATPGIGTFTEVANQIAHEDYIVARGDWVISDKDSFFGRYLSDKGSEINPSAIPLWPVHDVTHNQFATVGERHIFSSNLINQFSFAFSRPNTGETEPETTPVLNLFTPARYDVYIGVTGLTAIGANFTNPFRFLENKFDENESLLWTKGSHNIKIGGMFRREQTNAFGQTYWNGAYTFTSLANFLQAIPLSFTGAPNGQTYTNRDFRYIAIQPYFQDDWKVNRRLTLNFGLRYDWQSNPVDVAPGILHNVAYPPLGTGYSLVSHAWLNNPSNKSFDPRFGLAWDVFGDHKTSVRAGFGIMHDPLVTYTFFSGYDGTPPFLTENQTICPSLPCSYPAFPTPFATGAQVPLPSLTNGTYDGINTTPYMIQWNVNVEREILPNTLLMMGYVGSRGVHLLAFHDFNPPVPTVVNGVQYFATTSSSGQLVQNPRINPNFGALDLTDTTSYSRYNALQMLLKHNYSHNLLGQLSYTYSHCIDSAYTYGGLGGNNGSSAIENPYNWAADTGNCGFDIRHNLALNLVYVLPLHGNRLKEGWQLTFIQAWHTGIPFTVLDGFDRALLQNNFDSERPNVTAGCNLYANQNVHQWFNPGCFQLQAPGTVGNLGRNSLTAPGYVDSDFGVMKETKITEKINTQFRAELFNIFNHPNFSTPSLGVFSSTGAVLPTAGAITAIVGNARQVQFALKILF